MKDCHSYIFKPTPVEQCFYFFCVLIGLTMCSEEKQPIPYSKQTNSVKFLCHSECATRLTGVKAVNPVSTLNAFYSLAGH